MGLLNVTISHKENRPPAPRGYWGLPKLGRELLEDGLPFLYNQFKAEKITPVFWTATLPTRYMDGTPIGKEGHRLLLDDWSEIVRQVFQELSRELERLRLPQRWLYVIELQEERWLDLATLAPHIHAVLPNQYSGGWKLRHEVTDGIFARILSGRLGKAVDIKAACNIAPIHGMQRLSDYMTKFQKIASYMGKGSPILEQVRAAGMPVPSSWYGSDLDTKQSVRASVIHGRLENTDMSEFCDALDQVQAATGRSIFSSPFRVAVDGVSWYVAITVKIQRMSDISLALDQLIPLVFNSS
jgi:hypothetical protein